MKLKMKKILLTALFTSFIFCTPKKTALAVDSTLKNTIADTNCPKDGNCTVEVLKNKKLVVKTDDLGGTYFATIDDNQFSVIKYTYQRTVEKGLQDGHYNEEIIFEIKNNSDAISLTNQNLQETKMLFGRHCYCKGQAGYFKVKTGSLTSKMVKDKRVIDLNFTITEVPQIIKELHFSI